MLNFTPVRFLIILLYFVACTACGKAPEVQTDTEAEDGTTATDVNFLGGGTQAPEIEPEEPEYRSPSLSTPPPPTTIAWYPTIEQAVRVAQRNENKKIIVWFRNNECSDCITVEREVFTDPDVIALTRRWLFVKIDTDRMPERAEYLLAGGEPPAFVFLDENGNGYRHHYSSVTSEEFMTMLREWR
jgi:thioredoxin-related protein